MFIIVYTSVEETGEVETTVESTGHTSYREAQTKIREILAERVELGEDPDDYNDCTNTEAACLYLDSHGEGCDSMYKILEV